MSIPACRSFHAAPVTRVGGTLSVPGDKSISHRALLLGAVALGQTHVAGFLESDDCHATLGALRALGVPVEQPAANVVVITGVGMKGLQP